MASYEVRGKGRWELENEPQLVAFDRDSWQYIKAMFNPGGEYDNKGQECGYLALPDAVCLEIYKEIPTTKRVIPRRKSKCQ